MSRAATARIPFETARLQLCGFSDCDEDAQLLYELDSDPEVMRYLGPYKMSDVGAYRERLRTVWLPYYAVHPGEGFWAITEKADGSFAGWIFVRAATEHRFAVEAGFARASDIEIGYRLRRASWGRGIATEAARELARITLARPEVTSLVATALKPNRGSIRVMEKLGMSFVREFALPDFDDPAVLYAIVK